MDSCFDENQSELGVTVLTVTLEMFSHGDCFLDQAVQIFGKRGCKAFGFQDAQNFVASKEANLEYEAKKG